jgi:hypothetical protein
MGTKYVLRHAAWTWIYSQDGDMDMQP